MFAASAIVLSALVSGPPRSAEPVAWRVIGRDHGLAVCLRVSPATLAGRVATDAPPTSGGDPKAWLSTLRSVKLSTVLLHVRTGEDFCVWPTPTATTSPLQSTWRGGSGDLLGEFIEACADQGMPPSVSLSIIGDDRIRIERQLREVLDRRRNIELLRFDDIADSLEMPAAVETPIAPWESLLTVLDGYLSEEAIVSRSGPGLRSGGDPGAPGPWEAREVSVSLRPNWFWRQSENEHVLPLRRLQSIWYDSAGRGSLLTLHLPIDGRGAIAEPDARRLRELRTRLDAIFAQDLFLRANATAGGTSAAALTDTDPDSAWEAPMHAREATIEIELKAPTPLNHVTLAESAAIGARVSAFAISARVDGRWIPVATGAGVGPRQVRHFPTIVTDALRVELHSIEGPPSLAQISGFAAPPVVTIDAPSDTFTEPVAITLRADTPGAAMHYTLDGTTPTRESPRADGPLVLDRSARLRAIAVRGDVVSLEPAERTFIRFDPGVFRPAVQFIQAPAPGLRLRRHDGEFPGVRAMEAAEVADERIVESIGLPQGRPADRFGLVFEGFVEAPVTGVYTFTMRSDDGSVLSLHGQTLIDRDEGASWEWSQARIPLEAGWHPIRIAYYELAGEERLQIRWSGPGIDEAPIPAAHLAH